MELVTENFDDFDKCCDDRSPSQSPSRTQVDCHPITGDHPGGSRVESAPANGTAHAATASGKTPAVPTPAVSQQTRHARRIYVGGIPLGFADEDSLKSFLNAVISKGLNEENDNSYVLSVYINQKKCFTFV